MSNPATPSHQKVSYSEEKELTLVDLWNIVWRRKWPWLTFGILFGVLGIIYALKSEDIYRGETTLAPNNDEEAGSGISALAGQFGGLASMAGINIGGGSSTETALATLKSRQFLTPFLTKPANLQLLFPHEWDSAAEKWTVSKKRRDEDNKPTDLEAYEVFTRTCLNISEDKKTGLVTLAVEMRDPKAAASWSNQLVDMLNKHLKEKAIIDSQKNLAYLNDQLLKTKVLEIRESLFGLIESQTKNAMLANAKDEYAFKVIDPAVVPEIRVRPKRSLIVLASGVAGGFFGIFLCFVLYFVEVAKKQNNHI